MDVRQLIERVPEPAITARLRELLDRLRAELTPWQVDELLRSDDVVPHPADTLNAVRKDVVDAARLRERAARFAAAANRSPVRAADGRFDDVIAVLAHAAAKPAVASAIVWLLVGVRDEELGSHLIQVIRERAGLPRLTSQVHSEDVGLANAIANVPALVAWFSDRQVADTVTRIETVPLPAAFGPDDHETMARQVAAAEQARTRAPRVAAGTFSGFARRAAAFLVQLSVRGLDPLGFPLEREVQLDADPPLARRLELCAWARRAGHMISTRGMMLVLAIPIRAPWPWRLEVIAAEPGHGPSGCLALLLRLDGGGSIVVTARAPALLLVPDESDEERGARFERWLAVAYPHATAEWQAWI